VTRARRRERDEAFLMEYEEFAERVAVLVTVVESPWWQEQVAVESEIEEGE
jgi:hypothetical protein